MKIAIDTSPLSNANAVRGIGFYTKRLIQALKTHAPQHDCMLVDQDSRFKIQDAQLVHYPYFDPFFLTLPIRRKTPVVVTIHDCIMLQFPDLFPKGLKGWVKLQIQKAKLHTVDAIITDSHYSKTDIHKFYGIPEQKIHVAHLAVEEYFTRVTDHTQLESVKQKYSLPEKFLIKVGDINPTKNFSVTLQALAQIPDIHLVLVGKALVADREGNPVIPELQNILQDIQKYQLQDRVHRLGFVPDQDMPALYSLAKATLQNSLYEGFGLPALESLACATPVIYGHNSSLPEIVGENGFAIDASSIEQTITAIQKLYALSDTQYRQLSQDSLSQSQNFSLQKLADDTVRVYEQIINSKS